jgi:NADP-dependent 3-hydroxy acid dehydrogenase YdfG
LDPLQVFRLDGQVIIVTGASSGLGAGFARAVAAAGGAVVLAARRAA